MKYAVLFSCLVFAMAGCQSRLKFERVVEVPAGEQHMCYVEGPTKDQKVAVEFKSGQAVNVYVCLMKDESTVAPLARTGKSGPGVLASAMKQEAGSLEFDVPAKKEFVVIVAAPDGKAATVTLKIQGK
ncbi:MAG: hypothetical protein K1X57_03970 [Gemmataceae bacterium]|nr:hypothetical protein [Gemmataceae bacterium]